MNNMNNQIREDLQKIFLKTFQNLKENDFHFQKPRIDFENWDSLTHMQLVSELESFFKISFEMDEIVDINKPEDLAVLIEKKKNA